MTAEERAEDSALPSSIDECKHPEPCRTDHTEGDAERSPSFRCTNCNRLVFENEL
jgi:hypothetical protein